MIYNSTIPSTKFGDCTCCDRKDVECVKVGKSLVCIYCRKEVKAKIQMEKQRQKAALRRIMKTPTNQKMIKSNVTEVGISNLIADLDFVMSRYIRLKYADKDLKVQCYTCNTKAHYQSMQAGHYIHRTDLATRFLPENLRPQCVKCNCINHGNLIIFGEKLEAENEGITTWLQEQAATIAKPTQSELKELLSEYRQKLELLEIKLNIQKK